MFQRDVETKTAKIVFNDQGNHAERKYITVNKMYIVYDIPCTILKNISRQTRYIVDIPCNILKLVRHITRWTLASYNIIILLYKLASMQRIRKVEYIYIKYNMIHILYIKYNMNKI